MVNSISRREFIDVVLRSAVAGLPLATIGAALGQTENTQSLVFMQYDGLSLSPAETIAELGRLCKEKSPLEDMYSRGGTVEDVERYFARLLGKETAIFMPTGTLANHLALRALSKGGQRVIVQEVSHIYNDSGDATQTLSGLNLLPLVPEKASFAWADVERALAKTAAGRVATAVSAISIESPVRRLSGEMFDLQHMRTICKEARTRGLGMHLDGARLFIASAYTGVPPAEYASTFDTVYVSLWKYFNSINGAILAGPAKLLDGMHHTRRMFGGALWHAWPFVVLAQRYAEGFVDRFKSAIAVSNEFIGAIEGGGIKVERIPNGTNVFRLEIADAKADSLPARARAEGIVMQAPVKTNAGFVFTITVNETWNRIRGAALAAKVKKALQ